MDSTGPERDVLSAEEGGAAFRRQLAELGAERVAVVRNPSYVWAPIELYPLPPRRERLADLRAVVMDMDGTTTTTEPLCLHSLEYMVRAVTGRWSVEQWPGFDEVKDLPHVIGNSTTRHVEYLIATYGAGIEPDHMALRFLLACAWTLARGRDPGRATEIRCDMAALNLAQLGQDPAFLGWRTAAVEEKRPASVEAALPGLSVVFAEASPALRVRAAVTIYYQRYHQILNGIEEGKHLMDDVLAREVVGEVRSHLIEPMRGVALFLSMIKGMLAGEAEAVFPLLEAACPSAPEDAKERFLRQCQAFERQPVRLGVVTSSIRYEAEIVLGEVLRVIRDEVARWPVSAELRLRLVALFGGTDTLYDAFVTASDSSEIRLKPHRDLYAIALHRLGLETDAYAAVLGLEDSTAGVVAIQTAGCGLCVAVPFDATAHHDFTAADHVVRGGLAELMLAHGLFVDP